MRCKAFTIASTYELVSERLGIALSAGLDSTQRTVFGKFRCLFSSALSYASA